MTPQRTKRTKPTRCGRSRAENKRIDRALVDRIDRLIQHRPASREPSVNLVDALARDLSDFADLIGREFAALRVEIRRNLAAQ